MPLYLFFEVSAGKTYYAATLVPVIARAILERLAPALFKEAVRVLFVFFALIVVSICSQELLTPPRELL